MIYCVICLLVDCLSVSLFNWLTNCCFSCFTDQLLVGLLVD